MLSVRSGVANNGLVGSWRVKQCCFHKLCQRLLISQFAGRKRLVDFPAIKKAMFAPYNLSTKGYVVLYDAVPDDVKDHLRSLSRESGTPWIKDTVDGINLDLHRSRAFIPDATSRGLTVDPQRQYNTFFLAGTATDWLFLKTFAGAEDQHLRRNFAPVNTEDSPNVCSVLGSVFLAIQDNTYFYGYGWNCVAATKSQRKLVELNKGDLLLCRGDFVYAGVGYPTNNVLVRGYIDMPTYQRNTYEPPIIVPEFDDTRPDPDPFCFVWRCPFASTDNNSLRKHLHRFHRFYFRCIHGSGE
jgi:hypothetical protein